MFNSKTDEEIVLAAESIAGYSVVFLVFVENIILITLMATRKSIQASWWQSLLFALWMFLFYSSWTLVKCQSSFWPNNTSLSSVNHKCATLCEIFVFVNCFSQQMTKRKNSWENLHNYAWVLDFSSWCVSLQEPSFPSTTDLWTEP